MFCSLLVALFALTLASLLPLAARASAGCAQRRRVQRRHLEQNLGQPAVQLEFVTPRMCVCVRGVFVIVCVCVCGRARVCVCVCPCV